MTLSVYVHFPWCLQKCPYCDFASATIRRPEVPSTAYADAVLRELAWRAPELGKRTVTSVFFGGGTPSLWEPQALGSVLQAIQGAFTTDDALEVTVECNPSSLDRAKASALRAVGVNRLSIGVQSLDDTRLKFLGRLHDAQGALTAVRGALAEMPRVSADLMFGMPEQSADDFLREVAQLIDLGLSHVSAYALTIEPQTQFGELHRKGKLPLAKDDTYAETFLATERYLGERGFSHYEVSNYAKPGETSRHNQHYWRGGDYLGLGCAAVGCVDGRRYKNDPNPKAYLAHQADSRLEVFEEPLSAEMRIQEALMLGLRTSEGVNLRALQTRTGVDPKQTRAQALERALQQGNAVLERDTLRVPHERWLHLDSIVAALF
jgi:putative oxygen-independent coproporphyrinogen III oxidase